MALIDPIDPAIPEDFQGALLNEKNEPILDKFGAQTIVIQLEMDEAEELAAIVANALEVAENPYVLDGDDFIALDPLSAMTGEVAFLIYTGLLDQLGIMYEATYPDDESPAWDQQYQERTFSETTTYSS